MSSSAFDLSTDGNQPWLRLSLERQKAQLSSTVHTDDETRCIYNEMVSEYDDLRDLWYAWLFSRLHFLIAENALSQWDDQNRSVLDVGCGTRLQSFLYAGGWRVLFMLSA